MSKWLEDSLKIFGQMLRDLYHIARALLLILIVTTVIVINFAPQVLIDLLKVIVARLTLEDTFWGLVILTVIGFVILATTTGKGVVSEDEAKRASGDQVSDRSSSSTAVGDNSSNMEDGDVGGGGDGGGP